ncbi:hypothetical protein ABT272_41325 [Streptomyces sp900105245]|uniref:Uncharacterized protein n=1 Tax=Streptomyces sp. 900105245 TaxID=3154379 RepID=A0ABV1ULC7_9ACTN
MIGALRVAHAGGEDLVDHASLRWVLEAVEELPDHFEGRVLDCALRFGAVLGEGFSDLAEGFRAREVPSLGCCSSHRTSSAAGVGELLSHGFGGLPTEKVGHRLAALCGEQRSDGRLIVRK